MSRPRTWMLYGASGYTGALIAARALESGHRPVLAGRNAPAVQALGQRLGLSHRVVSLDDPVALDAALADVDVALNAAGPFLHTSLPLAQACLRAGVHYLDIGNELQAFRGLYDLHEQAQRAGVAIIPGVGFGVVATNCLARYVSDAVGGADDLEVASRAATAQAGPGVAMTRQENLPYGGWIRRAGDLQALPLGSGITTITLPDGPCHVMPLPTGDLEAAFRATGTSNVTAYAAVPPPQALERPGYSAKSSGPRTYTSFGWARATGLDGATAEAWLQTGESYAFTAAASVRAVEETLTRSLHGAFSPATAFGVDFPFTIENTSRIDKEVTQATSGAAAAATTLP